uniref:Replication protein A OB domain-containing protein n=1 Tax=Oryza glumipatula TaxID=40148 RepID=A0A0E0ATA0_9ORYZ
MRSLMAAINTVTPGVRYAKSSSSFTYYDVPSIHKSSVPSFFSAIFVSSEFSPLRDCAFSHGVHRTVFLDVSPTAFLLTIYFDGKLSYSTQRCNYWPAKLQDLIGVVSRIGPYDFASPTSDKKLRRIQIQNQEEQTQEVLLWGQYGESFNEAVTLEKSKEGIVVIIFAGLTAGNFAGKTEASSSSATQIHIDLDIPQVEQFRSSYKLGSPSLQQQLPKIVRLSPVQAAGKIYNLEEISAMPVSAFQGGVTYSAVAKVSSILSSIKWYYIGCHRCDKGYKLPVTITDKSGSLDAVAFSFVAEDLVELDAAQASQNMKIDSVEHPVTLNKAIGKTRLFTIGMNTDSSSKFPISYVLKRSFSIDDTMPNPLLTSEKLSKNKDQLQFPPPMTYTSSPSNARGNF